MDLIERFDVLEAEMKSEINELKFENKELKAQLSQQNEKILLLEKKITKPKPLGYSKQTNLGTKNVGNKAVSKKNENPSSIIDLSLLPKNCTELRAKGHFADGVYLVLNEETGKIDALLCGFPGAKLGETKS